MTEIIASNPSFFITLLPKMAIVALLVTGATVASERFGALIGGLIATLPIATGPVLVFLALDHDASFISQTALSAFSQTMPTAIFVAGYVLLAQRFKTAPSVSLSALIWLFYVGLTLWADRGMETAVLVSLMVFPLCILLVRPYVNAPTPAGKARGFELVVRASAVALLVAAVETLSLLGGPELTGVLAGFPIVFISMMVILHSRNGGAAAAAVLGSAIPGLAGVASAFLALHLLAVPLGTPSALLVGLCVSVFWNLGLFALHRLLHFGAGPTALPISTNLRYQGRSS